MWRRLPLPHRMLLAASFLYCAYSLVSPGLPAWRMYESVDPPEYRLLDRRGHHIYVEDYLPRNAYAKSQSLRLRVAEFVCEREPERGPFRYESGTRRALLVPGPGGCRVLDAPTH